MPCLLLSMVVDQVSKFFIAFIFRVI